MLSLLPAALVLPALRNNNTIDTFLAEQDPGLAYYRENTERFGGDHVVYVSVTAGDEGVFSPAGLARIDLVVGSLGSLDALQEVTGLTNVDAVRPSPDGVHLGPLVPELPRTREEAASLEAEVLASPLLSRLVAPGGTASLVIARLDERVADDPLLQNGAVDAIRTSLHAIDDSPGAFHLAGNQVIGEAIERYNNRDQRLFAPLMLLLVAVAGGLTLRRWSAVFVPLAVIAVAVAWTMGLFVAAGHQTNWVTSILTPILMLVGVADATHFLVRFEDELPSAATRTGAVRTTLAAITLPCLLTSLTTAAGFASLAANQVMPVRVFGLFAALGVLLALLATLVLAPAALSLGPPASERARPPPRPWPILRHLDALVQRSPVAVLLVALGLLLPVAWGASRVQVETNLLRYFQPDARVVVDSNAIEETFGGSAPFDVVVEVPAAGGALDPGLLADLARLGDALEATPGVARGVSLADLLQEIGRVLPTAPGGVPTDPFALEQLMLLLPGDLVDPLLDDDRRITRLSTRLQGGSLGLGGAREVLDGVERAALELLGERGEVRLTGASVLFIDMDEYLVQGQIRSFGLVLLVVGVLMIGLFRSLRVGLAAMIPNVLPIAFVLGLMGWLGLPLDGFTVMIASIAIGIGVDDTIHYLHHLRQQLREGHELRPAMSRTMTGVGKPLVYTSVVLALGFGVFCTSDFVGTRNFGLLTGATLLVALAADLLVLPAVLLLTGVPRRWRSP